MLPGGDEGDRQDPPRERSAGDRQLPLGARQHPQRRRPRAHRSGSAGPESIRRLHRAPDGRLQDGQGPGALRRRSAAPPPRDREPLRRRRQRLSHLGRREPDGVDLRLGLLGLRARARGRRMTELDEREVPLDAAPDRLDRAVAKLFGVSRGRAMEWIAEGRVRVGGKRAPKGTPVQPGARISVALPPPDQPAPEPDLAIRIVHADAHLVVADKPAGMPSHPLKPGETGTAANALVGRFPELAQVGPAAREGGLVHRLDTDTSGLLLAARTDSTHAMLRAQFAARTVEKGYLALVAGEIHAGGEIALPLLHDPRDPRRMQAASDL